MSKKNGVIENLSWKFAERILAQLVTFVVSIILARILEPADYGLISIVTIFITLANVFVSDGFGSALIQKKDADELDFSTVLIFNVVLSIFLYFILYFTAPFISEFYGEGYEMLVPVLRVLSLRLILSAINSVQQAYIAKQMLFQKFFWATLSGTIISAFVGIGMAILGYGVWSLVVQYLVNTFIGTIVLAVSIGIKFKIRFSVQRLKNMVGYGGRILGTGLIITGFVELRALIIGKLYSSADLAYYDKGRQFPNLIVTNINSSISAVLFPKMSNEQDNKVRIKEMTRNAIRFSAYIMCPMMFGLAAVAESFVMIVLTEKWLPCVSLLQLFCIVYLFQPIHTANIQAIKAIGRSDIYMKLEMIKKLLEIVVLLVVMWISVDAIVFSMAILTTLFTFVNAYPNIKLLNYSFNEQMHDILPAIIMSLVMALSVSLVGFCKINVLLKLIVQIVVGGSVYLILSVITKNEEFSTLVKLFLKKM